MRFIEVILVIAAALALWMSGGVLAASSTDALGRPMCNYCQDFKPLPREQVTTIEIVRNESMWYARCKRELPSWLFLKKRELEAQQ